MVLGLVIGVDVAWCHRVLQQDTVVQSELVTETTRKDAASQVYALLTHFICCDPPPFHPSPLPHYYHATTTQLLLWPLYSPCVRLGCRQAAALRRRA